MNPSTVVIAGASGFVGRSLIRRLLVEFPECSIVALSRSAKEAEDCRVQWKTCDLFSEESIARALPDKIDLVFYLVHSMEPTAALDQGSFADYDLIMADNFARACKPKGIHRLVYLGGLIPGDSRLSLHLQSRLEVERVFEEHNLPYTFLRAGLILGEGGSSFQILLKLVRRLRVMICPAWTQTLTSPVDLDSVLEGMMEVSKSDRHLGKTYDLAGCEPLTYLEMMRITAQALGLKRFFLKVPFFSPTLSRLWVSLITRTPKGLIYPLIESLEHPMVARDSNLLNFKFRSKTYFDLLRGISTETSRRPFRIRFRAPRQTVRSVQRLESFGLRAPVVSGMYFGWLKRWTLGLVAAKVSEDAIELRLAGWWTLIALRRLYDLSSEDRVTYAISGGVLVRESKDARLEFRLVLNNKYLIVAIHDYAPSLPWFVYRYTQAFAHLLVMRSFRRFLSSRAWQGV